MTITDVLEPDDRPAEAVFHVFRELNDHMRATEQKHLQVSVGFMSVTALALSLLVPSTDRGGVASEFHSWPLAVAYLVLLLAGCATMFQQHSLRGWKKQYLLASKQLVFGWPIADADRVNWMRTYVGPYSHSDRARFFRLAGDNILFWFVALITTCVAVLFSVAVAKLVPDRWITIPVLGVIWIAYVTMFVHITSGGVRRAAAMEDEWDKFRERQGFH